MQISLKAGTARGLIDLPRAGEEVESYRGRESAIE